MNIDLSSPVRLPEGKLGPFRVKHRYGKEFDVVSMREALLTGRKATRLKLANPIRIHELHDAAGLWIADVPIEVRQHREAIQALHPSGRVLVGGLGLGIAAAILAKEYPRVKEVDVVEISPQVVELCDPHLPNVHVLCEDFHAFIAGTIEWIWQAAFIDLWRGTNEGAWWEEVFPLRRLITRKFGKQWATDVCMFWAEDMMLGQVIRSLTTYTRAHWFYKAGLRLPMSRQRALWFVNNVGTPLWERRYGELYKEFSYE